MNGGPDRGRPPAAPHQRPYARTVVRADRARLYADRRRYGADQPGPWLLVRAWSVCGHGAARAEATLASRFCGVVVGAIDGVPLRAHARHRASGCGRHRIVGRTSDAAHLWQGPALRAPPDLWGGDG